MNLLSSQSDINTATQNEAGVVKIYDSPDGSLTTDKGYAATPYAVFYVNTRVDTLDSRTTGLETRVQNMKFMRPGQEDTNNFFSNMGSGGQQAVFTWEKATNGQSFLVARVDGTIVFAFPGFGGVNLA